MLAVPHYATLLGVPSGSVAAWALPASYAAAAVAGLCWGLILRARRPQVYATVGRAVSRRDQATLGEVAGYAAIVVHALRLTSDLERSRERIVVAREEERRRLRRDLHDGLGPALAAIALQLEMVGDLAGGQGTPVGRLAGTLRDQLRTAIADVRRIVDDLRPAILDDLGLAEALRTRASQFATASGLQVRVDIGAVPPLSAAAEITISCACPARRWTTSAPPARPRPAEPASPTSSVEFNWPNSP